MQPKHTVEVIANQPMISLESEFVDYQETQQLCPTREVVHPLADIPLEGRISRVAAALALIAACHNNADEARGALEAAIRIKDGSLTDLSAAHTGNTQN